MLRKKLSGKKNNETDVKIRCAFFLFGVVVLFTVFGLSGCSAEYRLAKTYTQSHFMGPVLLFMPEFIYKYNLKTDSLDLSGLTDAQKDSILWIHSDYVKKINDSIFLENYKSGYITGLQKYGIKVYDEQHSDKFFAGDSGGFVVNIAQIELEEQDYPFADTANVDGMTYTFHKTLNAVDISSWFNIKSVDNENANFPVLFAENLLTDDFDGFFKQNDFNGKIQYFYELDSLSVKKIYHYIFKLGQIYASYTYDYLLNKYLDDKLPENFRTDIFWHYDPYNKRFYSIGDNDRFESIKNKH